MANSVAIKNGQIQEKAPAGFATMGAVRCEGCGEEFIISHDPDFKNLIVAEQQAHWLENVLADEHDRNKKHPDRIDLPE